MLPATQDHDGKKLLGRLERLFTGMNMTVPKRKRALLLHYAGPEVDEIFDTLPDTGDDNDYATAVEKLNGYFSPQTNIAYEVYNFRQTKQKDGESSGSFHTRLRQLAKTCEFGDIDKEIKEHIILTCSSNSLRRRALRENLTLEALLKLGRALELSETQARQVKKPNQMLIKSSLTKPIDKVVPASESKNPHGHATPNRSHAIVTTQTSDPVHRGLMRICTSQESLSSWTKNLQRMWKNWSFCSCLQIKTANCG